MTKRKTGRRLVIAAAFALAASKACAQEACPSTGNETAQVAAVEPRLDLRLTDGRLIRLAGLDPALSTPETPDRDEQAVAALAAAFAHHAVSLASLSRAPDRWGRLVAFVFDAEGPAIPGGLARQALALGLGRYRSEPDAHVCRSGLVEAETQARAARLGLWSDPYYAVLAVDDQAGFAERAGSMVVVEGILTAVVSGPYRTTLRFAKGPERSNRGFSATFAARAKKLFEARDIRFLALVGRALRLRGLLDLRFGPQIELAGPDDLDVVAGQTEDGLAGAEIAVGLK